MFFRNFILIFLCFFISVFAQADELQELKHLVHSIKNNHVEIAQEIFEKNPDLAHKTNNKMLFYYAQKNNDMIQLLLENGADPNIQPTVWGKRKGRTPLHLSKDPEITRLLLEAGANPNIQEKVWMETPLHLSKDPEITRLLLAHGGAG